MHTNCPRSPPSIGQNFDDVLVPADHVSRNPNDTYYVSDATVLRCHTSAHQLELLKRGEPAFLITGDVYRWVAKGLGVGAQEGGTVGEGPESGTVPLPLEN